MALRIKSFFISLFIRLLSTLLMQSEIDCLPSGRLEPFDDKGVYDFPLVTKENLTKLSMCNEICKEDSRCKSYRYNTLTGACSTYGVGYSVPEKTFFPITDDSGSQLYLMPDEEHSFGTACNGDTDCDYCNPSCRNGSCRCALGFSYDVTTGSCVMRCQSYGDFFSKYPNTGVDYCNDKTQYSLTSDECMDMCRKRVSCVNAEYRSRFPSKCNLCDTAWYDLDFDRRDMNSNEWDLYYRHCVY